MFSQHFDLNELTIPLEHLQRLPRGRPLWLAYTIPWPEVDFLSILRNISESPRFYWDNSAHPVSLVGWGKAAELTDWGERRFHDIQSQVEHLSTRLYPINPSDVLIREVPIDAGPRWVGCFSFQPHPSEDSLWHAFPDAYFVLPRVQLARLDGQVWLTINHLVDDVRDVRQLEAFFNACLAEAFSLQAAAASDAFLPAPTIAKITTTLSRETWQKMVEGALERIRGGEFEKVVLARTLRARFQQPLAIVDILQDLASRYPDCYRFMIEPQPGQVFLGASPELLAEVRAPSFRTAALAGTIKRGNTPVEDDQLGQKLLKDPKERQEHAIVIRAIQGKLTPLTVALDIAPTPSLRKLGNVQHLETSIQGKLAYGWGVLDVVAALHPTPALGGWPQDAAQTYLALAEPFERGWYAAPIGWVDPWGNGLFAVGIRSGLFDGRTATLFAGAGIVADSNPTREWQETGLKFKPLLDAIGGALPHG
jgi:menaquinone-specific isochorismate synthase